MQHQDQEESACSQDQNIPPLEHHSFSQSEETSQQSGNTENDTRNKKCKDKRETVDTQEKTSHSCFFHPFDQQSVPHCYIQNYVLTPETGPGNLIDPVHEYKSATRAKDFNEMKKKINKELFRFAAGCMNTRTNGTIHFGIADSKCTGYMHGEIIGVFIEKKDEIIDLVNNGIKKHFENNADVAKLCIRQPRFVDVISANSTSTNKCVIEVDVVPSHSIVQGKLFHIKTLDEKKEQKKSHEGQFFIRDGASTTAISTKDLAAMTSNLPSIDARRCEAERKPEMKRKSNHGIKLKNQLTCGGKNLGYYDYYIIVTNKAHPEQLQHLQFMTMMKTFCVLDFDPDSAVSGCCSNYRKVRIANLHKPSQFNGDAEHLMKSLNLYKQTSWIFCNGREDLDVEFEKPLTPKEWLIKRAGEVQEMISFFCNPETLQRGKFLVIFLLLSPVEAMIDPIIHTFMSFYTNLGGAQNIMSICTSENIFQKWKDFIQAKSDNDISGQSIYELELSEINGTVLSLEQNSHMINRLLPSVDGSSVILKKMDEDLMPALDILCQNQCENVFDEDSKEFEDFKITTEAEFYRGEKVKWWNFYFSEIFQAKPFIKRDKYGKLKGMIRAQIKSHSSTCVLLNLFHHPGCGGTTLAMHVLWSLRNEFRCAVLKDNTVCKEEVAHEVTHLLRCGKSEQSFKTPVLLLVESSEEEVESTHELQRNLRKNIGEIDAFAIILNCIRSNNPKDRFKNTSTESEFITTEFTLKEQDAFKTKLEELQEIHQKPENFYSFMIMKHNFSQDYVKNVASNILKDIVIESRQSQLLAILALLNSYVSESAISIPLCEDFLGIKNALWGRESVLEKMEPYKCLLIEFTVEEYGVYKAMRFVHQSMALGCVKILEEEHKCTRSDIVLNMLHYDLFFKRCIGQDLLVRDMKSMLITRQRRTEGDEKDTLFSPLIEDIITGHDGLAKIQNIFTAASSRLDKDFVIPQALARHFYLNEKNFDQAKYWANAARVIKENSYTVDTVGQVSRSELRHKLDSKRLENKPVTPEELQQYLELAESARKAFKRAQLLAKTDDAPEFQEEPYRKGSYNISGYMGEIDIAMTVFDIIKKLPFFDSCGFMKNHYIHSFLRGKIPISHVPTTDNETNHKFLSILKEYEPNLAFMKAQVKDAFDFLEMYFTYMKEKGADKERELKNRKRIFEHYHVYVSLFCSTPEEVQKEKKQNPKLSLNLEIEECRMFLEGKKADSFPGLLQYLEDKAETVQKIAEKYSFIYQKAVTKTTKDKTNHLLSHIILKLLKPKSPLAKKEKELFDLLNEILQDVGTQHQHPEPYYLALLLHWPGRKVTSTAIATYVENIRKCSRMQFSHMYRARATIPHFFLGKYDGLNKLVPKAALDKHFKNVRERNVLWQKGEIFTFQEITNELLRVSGTIEQGDLYTKYGALKIPVRPVYIGGLRGGCSTERVSFYIGFAIDGPLAYDIKYEES
ncbi:sterile alpha motif domain-containing protein 9-like [Salminus brasiliensis]|uniref:sterile alpha motif domain-containing protein 9-like n=1 Tax=Salminus brasiliensis TaxID=930266 RepID=UPI003B8321D7